MPLVVNRLANHVAVLRESAAAFVSASVETVNAAAEAASSEAASYTADRYNLSQDTVASYISVAEANPDSLPRATVTLRVKAIPIESFDPQIVMKLFTYTDSRGRHVSRLLPAVYVTTLRGGTAKYLRAAFPLRTRTTGSLLPGDVIRRRIGADRGHLTRIRYYTFPSKFLRTDLVPHLQDVIGNVAGVRFKASWRKTTGELRNGSRGLVSG